MSQGSEAAVVESVKAASDVYAPVSGEIVAANEDLSAHPEHVNESPYESGWLFKIRIKDKAQLAALMASAEYAKAAGV